MNQSLRGAYVLVTRPQEQADALCKQITDLGGQPLRLPCLEIAANPVAKDALEFAAASDYWLFTSRNAVKFAQTAFDGKMPSATNKRIGAIGQATAIALQALGLKVDCLPQDRFNSEALLEQPLLQAPQLEGKKCSIFRGVGGRELLAEVLQSRGAQIRFIEVYQRCPPTQPELGPLITALQAGQLQAITATSVETVQNLVQLINPHEQSVLKNVPLIVVSQRIAHAAERMGFNTITVTQQPADEAIVQALLTCINGENSGRAN